MVTGITTLCQVVGWIFGGTKNCFDDQIVNFDHSFTIGEIPIFGLIALEYGWFYNIWDNLTYVGIGTLCPRAVNYGMLFGAVLAQGIMFPLIEKQSIQNGGDWFDEDKGGLESMLGYKVFFTLSCIMGGGIFTLFKMGTVLWKNRNIRDKVKEADKLTVTERINDEIFLSESIPFWLSILLFVVNVAAGTLGLSYFFNTRWYMCLTAYMLILPFSAVCCYIGGLSDWALTSTFAKLTVILFSIWCANTDPDNYIIPGLLICGIIYSGAHSSTDLMGDFKTAHLTRTSPRVMFFAQIFGHFLGIFIVPGVYFLYAKAFPDIGFIDAQ